MTAIIVSRQGVRQESKVGRIDAVGALTCGVGAWWWARALGQRLTDRAWRRFQQRRTARVRAQPAPA